MRCSEWAFFFSTSCSLSTHSLTNLVVMDVRSVSHEWLLYAWNTISSSEWKHVHT